MLLHELIILMSQLIGSLVRSPQFGRPFLVLNGHSTIAWDPFRLLHAFIAFAIIEATITTWAFP